MGFPKIFATDDEKREQIMADLTKVDGSCFRFTGAINPNGYGKVGSDRNVHRFMLGANRPGYVSRHYCSNRDCWRHVIWSRCSENIRDQARSRSAELATALKEGSAIPSWHGLGAMLCVLEIYGCVERVYDPEGKVWYVEIEDELR